MGCSASFSILYFPYSILHFIPFYKHNKRMTSEQLMTLKERLGLLGRYL